MFSAADLDILSRTIFGEARGQEFRGQVAVGWVVRNRAIRPNRFSPTVAAVCLKPLQFSCWNRADPTFERMVTVQLPDPAFVSAMTAAGLVLLDHTPDPTDGADHYHSVAVQPRWAQGMKKTARIGDHIFYKEPA